MSKEDSGPVHPLVGTHEAVLDIGLNLRAYAAIQLRQPDSGIDWLDEMIRKAQRDELARTVMDGVMQDARSLEQGAKTSYQCADAMLAAREEE